jgi:hypothetical protein
MCKGSLIPEIQPSRNMKTVVLLTCDAGCSYKQTLHTECGKKTIGHHLVWATLSAGSTYAQISQIMELSNIKCMTQKTFYATEQQFEDVWWSQLKVEMQKNGDMERRLAIERQDFTNGIPHISVITDGGYAKANKRRLFDATSCVVSALFSC